MKAAAAGALCIALIASIVLLAHTSHSDQQILASPGTKLDFRGTEQLLRSMIRERGAPAAFAYYLKQGNTLLPSQSHELAHAFGAALFEEQGLKGFATCGGDFSYGCYHQFIGLAISRYGLSVVNNFFADCGAQPELMRYGCLHGIGHGLVGYLGYSVPDLKKALVLCDPHDHDLASGCLIGAFMEYNMRELTALDSGDVIDARVITSSNVFEPCDQIGDKYAAACYFELPNWWISAADHAVGREQILRNAGTNCEKKGVIAARACFEGFGYVILPNSNADIASAVQACGTVTAPGAERTYCLSGVARRYKIDTHSDPEHVCRSFDLSDTQEKFCISFATANHIDFGLVL